MLVGYGLWSIVLLACSCVVANDVVVHHDVTGAEEKDEQVTFVPTSEWQTLQPGQSVPRGLHVRINLESGQKEAKILSDEPAAEGQGVQQSPDVGIVSDLKDVLQHIPDDGPGGDIVQEGSKQQFRSIEELKKDFEAIDVKFTSEMEILETLITELKAGGVSDERMSSVLREMEYYVHQYDNAQNFIKLGGLFLTMPLLNSSNVDIRSLVAFLLGSAMQSNPFVQVFAVDSGLLHKLLNRLAVDPSPVVKNKVLYALSCLIRRFPHAQRKFLELGGLSILGRFFHMDGEDAQKLQSKIVTMLYDLILEHKLTLENYEQENQLDTERMKQYETIDVKKAIVNEGWCRLVPLLLTATDHDIQDKCLNMMALIADDCSHTFVHFLPQLESLNQHYDTKVKEDEHDSYYAELRQVVALLIKTLGSMNRTEL